MMLILGVLIGVVVTYAMQTIVGALRAERAAPEPLRDVVDGGDLLTGKELFRVAHGLLQAARSASEVDYPTLFRPEEALTNTERAASLLRQALGRGV